MIADPHTDRARWTYRLALAAVLVVGAALRFSQLGAESVWLDEAYSIQVARGTLRQILDERLADVHPPLYYLALHFWMKWAGDSELGARLPSALLDMLTVLWAYPIALGLFGRRVALISTTLLAASPFHVEFAQEARMYALLGLLSTVSMHAFLQLFEPQRKIWLVGYILSTTLLLYTHIYGVFVLAAQAAILAWEYRRHEAARGALSVWLLALGIVVILYSPWFTALAEQASRVQSSFWIQRPLWIQVLHPFLVYSGSIPLACLLVPLAALGALEIRKGLASAPGAPRAGVVILAWLAAPIVLPFLISYVASPIFLPKYTIAASVPFAMLAAVGAGHPRTTRWRTRLIVAIAVLSVWRFTRYYETPSKDGWRDAVAALERTAQPNDVILFYPWFNQVPFAYYQRREDLLRLPFVAEPDDPAPDPASIPALAVRAVGARHRAWLVTLQGTPLESIIAGELGRIMTPVRHTVSQHVELYLFEKK